MNTIFESITYKYSLSYTTAAGCKTSFRSAFTTRKKSSLSNIMTMIKSDAYAWLYMDGHSKIDPRRLSIDELIIRYNTYGDMGTSVEQEIIKSTEVLRDQLSLEGRTADASLLNILLDMIRSL